MIYLSPSAVMMISGDGSKISFEPEELQTKLINSCIASGIKDYWIAEDISNAVESALSYQADNGIVFSEGEINSFILKILEDTGFSGIAESFKNNNKITPENIDVSFDAIKNLFEARFGLKNKELLTVAEKVLTACEILKMNQTVPSLLIELGRYYKNKAIRTPEINTLLYDKVLCSQWILGDKEIESFLSPETMFFVEKKLFTLGGVSSLFPSLKIDIKLEVLAKIYDLRPIITELSLFPCYKQPADAITEIISKISRHLKLKKIIPEKKDLPVYLRFSDIYHFAKKYLGASSVGEDNFCWNTVAAGFIENINYPVFVKGIKAKKGSK